MVVFIAYFRPVDELFSRLESLVHTRGEPLVLEVTRKHALLELIEQLEEYELDEDCLGPMRVNFRAFDTSKEAGIDAGGPSRELATLIAQQLPNSDWLSGK